MPADADQGVERVGIVIPAHDEESLLPRTLQSLIEQDIQRPMKIIVVANGCTDGTEAVARSWQAPFAAAGHGLEVLALTTRGKCKAINAGETQLCPGPRIYLDADVQLSADAVRSMVTTLESGIALCSPRPRVAVTRSRIMRMYGRVWESLPIVRSGVIGGGVLAVSKTARLRWEQFPEITADDYFIESHFNDGERAIAAPSWFEVVLPKRWQEMVQVRARWRRGKRELEALLGVARPRRPPSGLLRLVLPRPVLWPAAVVYIAINLAGRWRAWRSPAPGIGPWERSESSRLR